MRFLFVRILFPLLVFWLVRSVLKSLFAGSPHRVPQNRASEVPPVTAVGELKKDPVCGTYVSTASALKKTSAGGDVVYFCSAACRDRYQA